MKKSFIFLLFAACQSVSFGANFINFAKIEFSNIPAGKFLMGSCKATKQELFLGTSNCDGPDGESRERERPQHLVKLNGFQIGKYEVTLIEFKKFIIAENRLDIADYDFVRYNSKGDLAPVVYITWNDAVSFINWLNKNKPSSDTGVYRLPSEAEWEYAARGRTKTPYSFGDSISGKDANYGVSPWLAGFHHVRVGSYPANAYGVHDMHGNVWEWVADSWNDNYEGAPTTNEPWVDTDVVEKVMRGGCWGDEKKDIRVTSRNKGIKTYRNLSVGFRVVRDTSKK